MKTSLFLKILFLLFIFINSAKAEEFDVQLTPSIYAGGYNVGCHGANTGAINLFISGGTAPYTYAWSDGATIRNRSNLIAGYYQVIVTSSNGQSLTKEITLTEPDLFETILNPSIKGGGYNVSTNGGNDGEVNTEIHGGVPPYTFLWSNGSNSNNITELVAGNYYLTVHDATNCTATASVILTEPTTFHLVSITSPLIGNSQYNTSCGLSNGAINLTVTGGTPPYEYHWSNGKFTQNITDLPSGLYSVLVFDDNKASITASITLTKSPGIYATATPFVFANGKNTSCYTCNNGSITLSNLTGVTPLTFGWNSGQTTQNITAVAAGIYNVIITDALGCTYTSSDITLIAPEREVWTMAGNSGVTTSQYIGTNDTHDLIFKTNNAEAARITSSGDFKLTNLSGSSERFLKISSNGIINASSPSVPWETRGNDNINSSDYLGTKNNIDLIIKTNVTAGGGERMRFTPDGRIIISNSNQASGDLFTVGGDTKINGNTDIVGDLKLSSLNITSTELLQIGTNGILSHTSFLNAAPLLNYWANPIANEINYAGKVGIGASLFPNGETFHVNGGSWFDGSVNLNGNINFGSFTNTTDELIKVDASHNLSSIPFTDLNYWKKTTSSIGTGTDVFYSDGAVGIGLEPINFTSLSKYKLLVNGSIGAKEVVIRANGPWPDYVFEKDYELKKLSDVENFIMKYKHLPDMPKASEIEANGQSIAEIQKLQQIKIEELFLQLIHQQKEIYELKKSVVK